MVNFSINFSNPWFLLLLIPAFLLGIIPYFRLNKRYRKTRNRITSIVLHLIIMTLAISVLAGITFKYDTPMSENEVILLVDTSDSGDKASIEAKNDFIKTVIDNNDSMFKLGIVTFGYNQVYASPLSNDMNGVYSKYLSALGSADNSATDIASALTYTAELFENPSTARIVLISDAIETDGDAATAIKYVAAMGITVDSVQLSTSTANKEVQILNMTRPDNIIKVGEEFIVKVTIESSFEGNAVLKPYDNGTAGKEIQVPLVKGEQTVEVPYMFTLPGMHKLSFELSSPEEDENALLQNNEYSSFIYLEIFDDILIIEGIADESKSLCDMLNDEINVKVVNVKDTDNIPMTLDGLRAYDEIILCNVANNQLPEGFDLLLQSYVRDIGGGLFTICGNKEDSNPYDDNFTANAYTIEDMANTVYQDMLPVEVIEYTPPVAVMIIIDRSGSMYTPGGSIKEEDSPLGYAKLGAEACLEALDDRDYVGIMSLGNDKEIVLGMTPRTMRAKIIDAIYSIEGGGMTIFSDAIKRAGQELSAITDVEKRHMIIVTDGAPSSDDEADYISELKIATEMGITTSIVGINCQAEHKAKMISVLEEYAAEGSKFYDVTDLDALPEIMREDLEADTINEVNYVPFQPTVNIKNSVTAGLDDLALPMLGGFYGLRLKEGAQAIIMGDYTPIYSQWKYGKGTVGTFACDLRGVWSGDLIGTAIGELLVNNIVQALFPDESVKTSGIEIEADGNNYSTTLSIFTKMEEGNTIEVTVTSPVPGTDGETTVKTYTVNATSNYSRIQFPVTTSGIHEIRAVKKDAFGKEVASTVIYKSLAYSQEYNSFSDKLAAQKLSNEIAGTGHGAVINDPWMLFSNAVEFLHNEIDPRITFLIICLVLLLLEIAARKFKWKWPHEIIRDKRSAAAIAEKKGRR